MKQTFLVYIKDASGKIITFERFGCKRLETVEKNMEKLINNSMYCACIKGAATYEIYQTENTANGAPIMIYDILSVRA